MHLFTSSNNLLCWLQTATCFSTNDVQACEFFNPMKKHGWAPKLSFRFYNIPLNNASKIYTVLQERKHQQDENETDQYWRCSIEDVIEELTHSLLQTGDNVHNKGYIIHLRGGIYGTSGIEMVVLNEIWYG